VTRPTPKAPGATPRVDYPAYGDQALRRQWSEDLSAVTTLDRAVELLVSWRADRVPGMVDHHDALWIEARIEDRVAVLRFDELDDGAIDTMTLMGELIADACDRTLDAARNAPDVAALEGVVARFRSSYKPPLMPTVPFMRTEVELAEMLIRRRSLNWFDEPLTGLRERRGVLLQKEGITGYRDA
jgi:methane monooxygenase component A gamma chain